jgi:hypothetical protein
MPMEYFIKETGYSKEEQEHRNTFTCYRVFKVEKKLYASSEEIRLYIPFAGMFPIVSYYSTTRFLNKLSEYHIFEEHPIELKEKIYFAEKIQWLENSFLKYLKVIGISAEAFLKNKLVEKSKLVKRWMNFYSLEDNFLQ